jgi:ADP-ribose pyrophosphatase
MEIRKVRQLTRQKWLNLYAATYEHLGRVGRWIYASRQPQPVANRVADAVLIVPVLHAADQPPRLVLIREFRIPVGSDIYAFPAGLLDAGEDPAQTARRELEEETGFIVTKVKEISPILFSTAGLTDESVILVFVDAVADPSRSQQLDHSEQIEVVLVDFDGMCRLLDDRTLRFDAKMWTVLSMFRRMGRIE